MKKTYLIALLFLPTPACAMQKCISASKVACKVATLIIILPFVLLERTLNRNKSQRTKQLFELLVQADVSEDEALELIQKGVYVDAQYSSHWTLIHVAARKNLLRICAELIKKGANVNACSTDFGDLGETPLHLAASKGHAAVCKLLLDNGAYPYARTRTYPPHFPFSYTPLSYAVLYDHDEVYQIILERTLYFPTDEEVKQCRACVKTALLCLYRGLRESNIALSKDMRLLILLIDPIRKQQVATVCSALVRDGRKVPTEFLPCTVEELTSYTLDTIQPRLTEGQKRLDTLEPMLVERLGRIPREASSLLERTNVEKIVRPSIEKRIRNPRKCSRWRRPHGEIPISIIPDKTFHRCILLAFGTVAILWISKKALKRKPSPPELDDKTLDKTLESEEVA